MSTGRFIVLEGGEGVGKSTQSAFVRGLLEAAGKRVAETREPGGTALGERLREVLLATDQPPIHPETELLLMFAARAQHLQQVIYPALQRGEWVLCDRFTDASYAYQGGGRGLGGARVAAIEQWLQGDFRPDCVILLDAPVEVGLARAGKRGVADRFEQEKKAFFERVRSAYLERAAGNAERYRVIDASASREAVEAQIRPVVRQLLER